MTEIPRRDFLVKTAVGIAAASLPSCGQDAPAPVSGPTSRSGAVSFKLPELPYDKSALAPHLSAETLEFHYGKHHNAYVVNLNKLIDGTPHVGKTLEEIVKSSSGPIFNNAAQIWNHTFYWHSLAPKGGGDPSGALKAAIEKAFGSVEKFRAEFQAKAVGVFGSGWAWLVRNADGTVAIAQTSNAETPITGAARPLFTVDVWEHAYYIDYRNARATYAEKLWNLIDWSFAASNYERAFDLPGNRPS